MYPITAVSVLGARTVKWKILCSRCFFLLQIRWSTTLNTLLDEVYEIKMTNEKET